MNKVLLTLLLLCSANALSCAPLPEQMYLPFTLNEYYDKKREPVKPIITASLDRAKTFVPTCLQPSYLSFKIENASSNPKAGYVFKVHSSTIADFAISEEEIVPDGKTISFTILENKYHFGKPLEIKMEIYAILPNGKKSESMFLEIH
ncbi:MAG TPA: hypothetical protein VIC08_14690 [Cellvibrionaceae bacterium]